MRESADVVAIGGLLIEAKDTVDYGDWRAWLADQLRLEFKNCRQLHERSPFLRHL